MAWPATRVALRVPTRPSALLLGRTPVLAFPCAQERAEAMVVLGQGGVSTGVLHSSLCLQGASPDPARTPCRERPAWCSVVCTLDPSSSLLSPHRSVVMARPFFKNHSFTYQCLTYPFQVCSSVVVSMFTEFCRYQNSLILDHFCQP